MLGSFTRADDGMSIGAVSASSATGIFTPFHDAKWCDSDAGVGRQDPQIFVAEGTLRVYWSLDGRAEAVFSRSMVHHARSTSGDARNS